MTETDIVARLRTLAKERSEQSGDMMYRAFLPDQTIEWKAADRIATLTRERDAHLQTIAELNDQWHLNVENVQAAERERDAYKALAEVAQAIFDTFTKDEAQGFQSRDRHYVLDMLKPFLPAPTLNTNLSSKED